MNSIELRCSNRMLYGKASTQLVGKNWMSDIYVVDKHHGLSTPDIKKRVLQYTNFPSVTFWRSRSQKRNSASVRESSGELSNQYERATKN